MKMVFSCKSFTAIALCLVSILAKSSGELIVLRHPKGVDDYNRELTCLAEDDDSALIWNYNPNENERTHGKKSLTDFRPKNPLAPHINRCALWNSAKCIEEWNHDKSAGWHPVNSTTTPMAPVFDFRWEGFKEFVFDKNETKYELRYPYVGEVGASSGAAVFSVRGSKGITVSLCARKQVAEGLCFSIFLGAWEGTQSGIRLCAAETFRFEQAAGNGNCGILARLTHGASDYLDAYEWRTFIIKWDYAERTIKVFRNDDNKPFLHGNVSTWVNVPQIFVGGAVPSRIRFHFYEYFLSEQMNVRLYTNFFKTYHKIVRFKLLVGLCHECELSITLEDKAYHGVQTWRVSGNGTSVINELLAWQSVELDVNLENIRSKSVRLFIQTVLTDESKRGYWAVDSFRIYESTGGMRESTLSIGRVESADYNPPWLPAKCQKLSYNGSDLVDAFSTAQYRNTSQLQEFLRGQKELSKSGKNWFICDQTGCTCDRGFQGSHCSIPCYGGSYGFNCKEKCESCNSNNCAKKNGYCHNGCKSSRFLQPFCKTEFRLAEPTVTDINDTTATLIQELESGADVANNVTFRITEMGSNTSPNFERSSTIRLQTTYKEVLSGLKSSTTYQVQTVVPRSKGQSGEEVKSSEIFFSTTCLGKHQFEILPGETNVTVTKPSREQECGDLTAPEYRLTLSDAANKTKCNRPISEFPHICSQLSPYTEYMVKIESHKHKPWITKFRTLGLVPKSPLARRSFPKGHGILEFRWAYSFFNETSINRFRIYVRRMETNLQAIPTIPIAMEIDYPATKGKIYYEDELHLLTATRYEIDVVAVSQHNVSSPESKILISMPAGVAFASGEELHATHSGTLITLKVPEVINATTDTWVLIVVKDLMEYSMQNRSRNLSSFANMTEWLADKYKVEESQSKYVTIDCNQNGNVNSNCSLRVGGTYTIWVNVTDLYTDATADLPPLTITLIDDEQNLTWLIIFPIIAIPVILLFMWHRKSKRVTIPSREPSYLDLSLPPFTTTRKRSSTILCTANSLLPQPGTAEDQLSAHVYTIPKEPDSRSVSAEYFEEYTKEGSKSGLLYSQFMLLRTGLTKPCEYGRMPENMLKNRYRNLVAYDDSRVILEKIPGEPYSDYINASYIKGYKKDKAFIATQGPKPNTVNDFWRMVWQEKVRIICMLTNLIEGNKTNCEKYWPDVGTRIKYSDLHISTTDQQVFADYTFRTFELSYKLDTRTVRHLHYTGWPSLGVPTYLQSLVAYLKKLEQTPAGNGPVVVHCHTGNGRTGTMILCDICLRQAAAEKVIDVTAVTTRMRDSRANMVGTLQQYVLAHIIIAESMVSMPTQIPCTDSLAKGIKKMRMRLPTHILRLNDTMWQGQTLQSLTISRPPAVEDVTSDQIPEYNPGTPVVIYDDVSASKSNWIHAVCVDGVKMKNQYLASCLPAPFTLADFWTFVAERKIKLIIILQCSDPGEPTCCDIMPDESVVLRMPDIQVENKTSLDDRDYFTTEELLLTDTSEENTMTRSLTVLTCKGWGRGKHGKPPKPMTSVSLWRASEKIPRNEGQTLVLCHDGISGCGLYLALSFLLERMAVERECDIISAVRTVRRSHPEFVQTLEQCEYLYDAAQTYAEYFECYANFT